MLGEGNIKDVAYIVKVDGEEVATSSIGIMKPGATKNSAVAFTIPNAGQHTIEVVLRYADEAGQLHYMEAGKQTITIEKGENPQGSSDDYFIRGNASEPNYVGMGALAAVIVILFFTFVIIMKKK